MDFDVVRHADGARFLDRAARFLLRNEAEHNLVLGLAERLRHGPLDGASPGAAPPIYFATVEAAGEVVGCAFRTPPFKLGLTRMPSSAVPALVRDVADVYDDLPAVLGPAPVSGAFAERWAAVRGVAVEEGMRQRIYRLEAVVPPEDRPPGALRRATAEDLELLTAWHEAFRQAAMTDAPADPAHVAERVGEGLRWIWDDGGPRCMAGIAGRSPNGARIGPVYTPPEWRGRGYGTACTAALSQRVLDGGARFCFLYTDLANPTSNHIYQRIGYQPVTDVLDHRFRTPVHAHPPHAP